MSRVPPEIREHAERRARYLAGAYDIDEGTREAFVNDLTLEIVGCVEAFLVAMDKVAEANAEGIAGAAPNRAARREIAAKLRRKK